MFQKRMVADWSLEGEESYQFSQPGSWAREDCVELSRVTESVLPREAPAPIGY